MQKLQKPCHHGEKKNMSELLINKVNIWDTVTVSSCIHEMHAGGRSDSLTIKIYDPESRFDRWKVDTGTPVEFKDSGVTSGNMFLYNIAPEGSYYILHAYSMPVTGTIPHTKTWDLVHFQQIGKEIAERNNLEFESYGLDDIVYKYMAQENEPDFKFFGRLCTRERASLTIYDGKLIASFEPYLESLEPTTTLSTEGCIVECEDSRLLEYGSAIVKSGVFHGEFKSQDNDNNERVWIPNKEITCQSNAEAIRFATAELREKNKMLVSGSINGSLMAQIAPGIMMNINNVQMPSWSGTYYIYKVRHDYGKKKSKIFFRRRLEGY